MPISVGMTLARFSLLTLGLHGMNIYASTTLPEHIALIKAGENEAKQRCLELIHFDTLKFEPCIKQLTRGASKTPFVQLGILYSGYVSAINFAHGGLPGSRQTAWSLLDSASKLQKQLSVDNYTLCETLPGNCKIRIQEAEEMLRAGPPKPAKIPRNNDAHGH